jgi:glycosyltransferase involved in cell wall biosynthesis
MKIALVCDWLTGMRGGERCLEAVCKLYPDADIFTLIHIPGSVSPEIESHKIYTSYIQKLPGDSKTFRRYLPLFAHAIRKFDLSEYDCVLSFSHCVAKNVRVPKGVPHICYCHTPMRYAWDMRKEYLSAYKGSKRWAIGLLLDYLKHWDKNTASRVTHFIANSKNIRNRIKKAYNRDSIVIYPPVDCGRFAVSGRDNGYYLIVSALVPYKRVDLAIAAFAGFDRKILVVGNGPELPRLKVMATTNVTFIENASDSEIAEYMQNCTALIFPGEEDFGIVPLEAQACGKSVIAFGVGGALETVIPYWQDKRGKQNSNATGIFFYEQSPDVIRQAILQFEELKHCFNPLNCRGNAERFNYPHYLQAMRDFIQNVISGLND